MSLTIQARREPLFTIGYEGRSIEELLSVLALNRIDLLVDVRENAVSRKAGFSKRALAEALGDVEIEYSHEPLLGNPRENRAGFHGEAVGEARRLYLQHLNNGSREAYEAVIALTATRRVALLCFERDERKCHRSCIVEQAKADYPMIWVCRL